MAENKPSGPARRGKGRVTILGFLLAVVGAVALYLSDCIPGFGLGGGPGEGEGEKGEPTEEPAKQAKPDEQSSVETPPVPSGKIVVGVGGCALEGEQAQPCEDLCKRISEGALEGAKEITIDAKEGTQASVVTLLDCLKDAGHNKIAVARE